LVQKSTTLNDLSGYLKLWAVPVYTVQVIQGFLCSWVTPPLFHLCWGQPEQRS